MSADDPALGGELFVEEHFAMVPEWILRASISDCAVRLYAVLLRYGQTSGVRMPGRKTLATRLHKKSTDTVDRAMRELVLIGAVQIEARYSGRQQLTNRYRVRVSKPPLPSTLDADSEPVPTLIADAGRRNAATPIRTAGCTNPTRGSRTITPPPAADPRHNPESSTDRKTPPLGPTTSIASSCAISDWDAFVAQVKAERHRCGQPTGRWAGPCLDAALRLAVGPRGWPAGLAGRALLFVAADPASRSPMRVAEGGPWWDQAEVAVVTQPDMAEVEDAEHELGEVGGLRVALQADARAELRAAGRPVTRASLALTARRLLHEYVARKVASGE